MKLGPETVSLRSRPGPRRRRNLDEGSLLAIGSWGSHNSHEFYHAQSERLSSTIAGDDFSAKNGYDVLTPPGTYEDFILFPNEHGDVTTDAIFYPDEVPSAPMAPRIPRLHTPDLAPLSTDIQFFPCHDEEVEDRINETWYLAGREKIDKQRQ
ncbi:hypothetical protein CCHL11_10313 [Colletotrichum chlorophyti]|uniref:Uncharacterized protein n=1 Tax=Colletotrichum chlorophyti TaxID=708187 RepID=A0A1Q8RAX1_9PEZI|nr:hypothetical protein CCHL11_10313 [Colletotrichum chlorophyti]